MRNRGIEIDRVTGFQGMVLGTDAHLELAAQDGKEFHSRMLVRADLLGRKRLKLSVVRI
jgi:hypothetical protein